MCVRTNLDLTAECALTLSGVEESFLQPLTPYRLLNVRAYSFRSDSEVRIVILSGVKESECLNGADERDLTFPSLSSLSLPLFLSFYCLSLRPSSRLSI